MRKNYSNLNKREIITFAEKIKCLIITIIIFLTHVKIHIKRYNHKKKLHEHINKKSFFLKLKI